MIFPPKFTNPQIPVILGALFHLATLLALATAAEAAEPIPHHQSAPPNPPRSPQEAAAKMTVPDGFKVEVVASEPAIVNPVAMTFDDRGRAWITESFEYPRKEPGKGRDTVKVLEDTDGDGTFEKVTIFAEGLNIPSGIAVGHGGVWVVNSPDILFLQDTDGDGKADTREVVVTGFGRTDTHELPNSLTWGPDGWLYGLNGVFNFSHVKHGDFDRQFTCALFRINPHKDPKTGLREFQLFAEGTSNPWGVAWDPEGNAFISACVIDHLWHLTESGYYHRQGGPYPESTWKLESIVNYKHQMAAYCGITYFDSPAYPEKFRGHLYMGNIHGGCINVDSLTREGPTYRGKARPDFLTANDAWFMPVVQKTGPDGSLYILDWYDRYHCYQDANRDPKGIDRERGRLYRVRYRDSPRAPKFDLQKHSTADLIARLGDSNIYFRESARRILQERGRDRENAGGLLENLAADQSAARQARMHALWSLAGMSAPPSEPFLLKALADPDPGIRNWSVRIVGNARLSSAEILAKIKALASDESPDVVLQVAIAAPKLPGIDPGELWATILAETKDPNLTPKIIWQNLLPRFEQDAPDFLHHLAARKNLRSPAVTEFISRFSDRMLSGKSGARGFGQLLGILESTGNTKAAASALGQLRKRIANREIKDAELVRFRAALDQPIEAMLAKDGPLALEAALLATTWGNPDATARVRAIFTDHNAPPEHHREALDALAAAGDESALDAVGSVLNSGGGSLEFKREVLGALTRFSSDRVGEITVRIFPDLHPTLRATAIELLTSRPAWSKNLLAAIRGKAISRDAVNQTQVRTLAASADTDVAAGVKEIWGIIRSARRPDRDKVITRIRGLVQQNLAKADPKAGHELFNQRCSICHVIYGQGVALGPEITVNGRGSFEQLLSNVLDPNLVIGGDYQTRVLTTKDGRTFAGLVQEENDRRIVLKLPGGSTETVPRDEVAKIEVAPTSLMPEALEMGFTDEQLVNLFAFLGLDKAPGDPDARWISGIEPAKRQSP